MAMNLLTPRTSLSLEELRDTLIRLEDTIIFGLIERAQFKKNDAIYQPRQFEFASGFDGSFLEFMLWELEKVHATTRRYQSPDEYSFFTDLPDPILPPLDYPQILHPNDINVNDKVYAMYTQKIIPRACQQGDDSNYGSSATKDVENLQNLSKRIHFGKFIAEAKFQDPKYHDEYVQLIKAKDTNGIMDLLTNREVEAKLLKRLRRKALIYGQDIDEPASSTTNGTHNASNDDTCLETSTSDGIPTAALKINTDVVVDLYQDYVIPLTKEVEVDYLLKRLD
ncbi:chorismate mutase aro7 [Dimargaris xerosporica]|nr:chorismate mutase aro7 [Dimargaris xerosporica]